MYLFVYLQYIYSFTYVIEFYFIDKVLLYRQNSVLFLKCWDYSLASPHLPSTLLLKNSEFVWLPHFQSTAQDTKVLGRAVVGRAGKRALTASWGLGLADNGDD